MRTSHCHASSTPQYKSVLNNVCDWFSTDRCSSILLYIDIIASQMSQDLYSVLWLQWSLYIPAAFQCIVISHIHRNVSNHWCNAFIGISIQKFCTNSHFDANSKGVHTGNLVKSHGSLRFHIFSGTFNFPIDSKTGQSSLNALNIVTDQR